MYANITSVFIVLLFEPTFSLIFTGELISAISLQVKMLSVKEKGKKKIGLKIFLTPTCHSYTHKD